MTAWALFGFTLAFLVIFLIGLVIVVCDILGWVFDRELHARLRQLANHIIMNDEQT